MKLKTLKSSLQTIASRVPVVEPGTWRTEGQTSAQRGYSYKWQKARATFLLKYPYCQKCAKLVGITEIEHMAVADECLRRGIPLPTAATVVDHKIPHRGDMKLFWDSTNWQGLCATHHSRDKQREEQGL